MEKLLEEYSFLNKINKPASFTGREEELKLLEECFYKKRMKNFILIGNAGCGKTILIEKISNILKDKYCFLRFDIAGSVAGTRYRGDFESRLINVLNRIARYNSRNEKEIILFIDEIHTIYKAGGAEGAIDASNIFKPYLSEGKITIIGATTPEEYEDTIKRDKALSRRLSPIFIKDLGEREIKKILKKFGDNMVNNQDIDYIYNKSLTIPNATNPDISIEILDRCMARSKCRNEDITPAMIDNIVNYMINYK